VVGPRTNINVAMHWTDFDADGQATIMLSLLTGHGRATPLLWLTVDTAPEEPSNDTNIRSWSVPPTPCRPISRYASQADRGSGDQKLFRVLTEQLKFDYVIRFRGTITVTALDGETRTAVSCVGPGGRAKVLRGTQVTADHYQLGTVLCARQGYEAGLVPGRQPRRGDRQRPQGPVRQTLENRVRVPRHKGFALWHEGSPEVLAP
jgi:hypothetical protein